MLMSDKKKKKKKKTTTTTTERERATQVNWCLTFKISATMEFGPREEKWATRGAVVSTIASLFSIVPSAFLKVPPWKGHPDVM